MRRLPMPFECWAPLPVIGPHLLPLLVRPVTSYSRRDRQQLSSLCSDTAPLNVHISIVRFASFRSSRPLSRKHLQSRSLASAPPVPCSNERTVAATIRTANNFSRSLLSARYRRSCCYWRPLCCMERWISKRFPRSRHRSRLLAGQRGRLWREAARSPLSSSLASVAYM